MKVGDTIWRFDSNRRVYPPRRPGQSRYESTDGPIYREYWHEVEITGETRVSWITAYGKVPKRATDLRRRGWAFTLEDVERDCWVNDNIHKLQRALSCCLRKHDENVYFTMQKLIEAIDFREEKRT